MARYTVNVSRNAEEDLAYYRVYERRIILEGAFAHLSDQPDVENKYRKRLRENAPAPWEVKIHTYRVFYTVEAASDEVIIVSIGHKNHNVLYIRGKVVRL